MIQSRLLHAIILYFSIILLISCNKHVCPAYYSAFRNYNNEFNHNQTPKYKNLNSRITQMNLGRKKKWNGLINERDNLWFNIAKDRNHKFEVVRAKKDFISYDSSYKKQDIDISNISSLESTEQRMHDLMDWNIKKNDTIMDENGDISSTENFDDYIDIKSNFDDSYKFEEEFYREFNSFFLNYADSIRLSP